MFWLSYNANKKYDYRINDIELINIMSSLNTNCAVGFAGIPNECFKYGIGPNTVKLVKIILETCALDASKAFDKVRREKLWITLIDKAQPHVIRSLMNYYGDLKLIVNNNNEYSKIFNTTLGVKQGGPASPRLFTIYMEPLTHELEKSNIGVKIGDLLINHLMYADDVLLISTNIADLNKLLEITTKFGLNFELKFNPAKTQFMICDRFRSKFRSDPNVEHHEINKYKYKI